MADFKIKAGELNTLIKFQQPTTDKKTSGAQTFLYADLPSNANAWSKWVYDHGQEAVSSDADKSTQRATVTIRFRSDVSEKFRIVHKNGSIWKIISLDLVRDRNRWIEMRVERVKGTVP